jgi:BirA family biotin operon repressor/biotin-[acetyl-CoA-carboxylase] ligase
MSLTLLTSALAGLPLGEVRFLPETGSTNADALEWAEAGAPDFSLVAADRQTAGRGRLDRRWVTNPGSALAFSLVVRPAAGELPFLALFSPWAGLGVARALETLGLHPEIKWPNDVLLRRRKVCGILLESRWQGQDLQALVVGVGINIAPSSVPPAEELLFPADCIEAVLGRPVDRWGVLREVLSALINTRPDLGSLAFQAEWEKRLAFRHEWVTVVGAAYQAARRGRVLGLEADGSLRLADPNGQPFTVQAGEVSLRPIDAAPNDEPSTGVPQ